MKNVVSILLCSVFYLVGTTFGAVNWTDAGSDHSWDNGNNWSSGNVPAASDSTYIRAVDMGGSTTGPTISSTGSVARNLSIEVGAASSITMEMTGGTLDIYFPGATNCYFRLGAGTSTGKAVFNMSGGVLTVNEDDGNNGYVRVGYGYRGEMFMSNDARIEALDLLIGTTGDKGIVDLSDNAMIILGGDETLDIEAFIDQGVLTSFGGTVNNVAYSYDSATDLTTITAIPEPSTLLVLGLGCAMLRKKRN